MRRLAVYSLLSVMLFAAPAALQAQAPTSREIPFNFVFSHLPFGSTQTITVQVWDAATGGNLIFSEVHQNIKVGFLGEIDFILGSLTAGGIPVGDFPSGASRYLDVVDIKNTSVLLTGRFPLYANAFALTPGAVGPQGPIGPQGPQGPSGATGVSGGQGQQGLQGPTGSQGAPGLVNRGAWNATIAYVANDAVSDTGSYWLAVYKNTASEPSMTNSNWQQLAAAGATGQTGLQGQQGAQGVPGAPGANGATGATGAAGPQGPRGPAGINNKGVWSASANYSVGDAITDGGSYWLALVASGPASGNSCKPSFPPDPCIGADWQILAAAGSPGTTGPAGPQGIPGPAGTPGAMGSQGPAGPAGPVPTGAAITTASNTFTGSQTINGALIITGAGNGIQFSDGTVQTTASTGTGGSVPPGYAPLVSSTSPTVPPGYNALGPTVIGNKWASAASLHTDRWGSATVSLNGKIYAIGGADLGSNSGDVLPSVEVYDPATNTWTSAASMNTARAFTAAATMNGKIYALGGQQCSLVSGATTFPPCPVIASAEMYDPSSNTWTPIAPMNTARTNLAAVALNGKIYAIGGALCASVPSGCPATNVAVCPPPVTLPGGCSTLSTVEAYDPSTNSWSMVSSMNAERELLAAVSANGKIYAIGGGECVVDIALAGLDICSPTLTAEVYDPSTNSWAAITPLNAARYHEAAVVLNGKIYAVGGFVGGTNSPTVMVYDLIANTWTPAAPLLIPKVALGAAEANGLIYAVGGGGGSGTEVEVYTPPSTFYTFIKN